MATYNVTAQTRRVQYTGDGTAGNFAFSFQINQTSELKVYVDSTEKTESTHYTVTLNSGTGAGTVAFTSGNFPTSSETVTLLSDIPLSRTSVYTSGGQLTASSLEDDFDTNMFIHQQTNEEIDRSLRLAEHDVISGADMTLPIKATRAGKILGFNETTGNPEASIFTADAQTLADIASDIATLADIEDGTDATDAIQTVAGISSNVSTVSGISSNVTTVAGISSDVTAVAGDATDIGTVASNISSVNTVATNIADVITVANDLAEAVSEVETVANDLNEATSEIEVVANAITNVDTVGTNIANVNTVAGISSNVTTVAGINANVTTVAGVSSDVTTVAGISSNVTTVADNDANITTVAGNIANITTVQAVDTDITTVAGQISPTNNISTVAGIASNISTVAGISTDVTAVSAISTDVSAVEDIKTNVTTVAGVSSDVTTVAGISGNVTTVAGISSNVSTVAGISANVTTVAGDTTAINAVASDATDIGTVATNIANVNTVAGISANVTTVAGDTTNIGTIATDLTGSDNIGTVAGSISNVNSVGGSIANVNTVATNLSSVNSFADTYRIGATDPTTSLDTGDLFYNTTSSTLKVYTGSAWEQGVTAGSGFLPLTGGALTGNLTFGDNNKAIFGAGADLQIYHNGTNSIIEENSGAGSLIIKGTNISFEDGTGAETYATFIKDGAATIRYDNSTKLTTTNTGIDVTGVITTDGMTTSADINFGDNDKAVFGDGSDLQIYHDGTNSYIDDAGSGVLWIRGDASVRIGKAGTSEVGLRVESDSYTKLYYDNAEKLSTTSTGIDVTGTITFDGGTTSADLNFGDNDKAIFGAGSDLQIYHTGTESIISDAGTGNLKIYGENLELQATSTGETYFNAIANGAVTLYHNNSAKLATKSDGVDITGELQCDTLDVDGTSNFADDITLVGASIYIPDNESVRFGAGQDLVIFHDGVGGGSYINEAGTGDLFIQGQNIQLRKYGTSEVMADFNVDGAVQLFYDNSEKLATTSTGININGNINAVDNIYLASTVYHEGDTNTYIQFHAADQFRIVTGGTERLEVNASAIVFNDGGSSYDFRVESDTSTHMLFVDGSSNRVGINDSTPSYTLDVAGDINFTGTLRKSGSAFSLDGASKAWLSYNGDSATVRDSFNVSSVTDNGTGDYTTNIDNSMANSSYAVSGAISAAGSVNSNVNIFQIHSSAANTLSAPSTGAFRAISLHDPNDVKQDVDYFTTIVHGDAA